MSKPFCAICTRDIVGAVKREILDGRLVIVCSRCTDEKPIARASERGYQAPYSEGSTAATRHALAKLGRELGARPQRPMSDLAIACSPGFVLVRVPQLHDGQHRDEQEARATFAQQPWASEARYLGSSGRGRGGMHLFERPDAEAARRARMGDADPLESMEQYRSKP